MKKKNLYKKGDWIELVKPDIISRTLGYKKGTWYQVYSSRDNSVNITQDRGVVFSISEIEHAECNGTLLVEVLG